MSTGQLLGAGTELVAVAFLCVLVPTAVGGFVVALLLESMFEAHTITTTQLAWTGYLAGILVTTGACATALVALVALKIVDLFVRE